MKRNRCASVGRPRRPTGDAAGSRTLADDPGSATEKTATRDDLATAVWTASLACEILGDAQEALFSFRHPRERMRRAVRLLGSLTLPAEHRVEHAMREFFLAFGDDCPAWAAEQVARIRSLTDASGDAPAFLSRDDLTALADAFFDLYDLVCRAEA